ncbi:hypothetical protein INT45_002992 [Circinella minor]|uniref:DDE Tnp4 domain-containing protein n=1 Tax=Circinella minor TaxID=1195481 RepID=A0A8H7VC93_9FUNG|nr:hypothetical protein INT45_002992 [Circinella minor]
MPRYSKKRQIEYTLGIISGLEAISNTTSMLIDGDDGDYGISCDPENDLEDNSNDRTLRYNPLSLVPWGELLDKISSQRYLDRSQKIPRAPSRIDWLFNELDDERFTQEVRMSKDAFNMILDKIKDDPIFVSSGPKPQKPVFLQLLVTTRRLGFYGNGASIGNIARYYGVREGSVIKYTNRCIKAICLFESTYIHWPSEQEKYISKKYFSSSFLFDDCLGIIDGTLFFLANEPCSTEAQSYFSYKKKYGISGILVCNSNKQIIYSYIGWPGSTHDSRIFSNSSIFRYPGLYFKENEYLLGDSGFECLKNIIVLYKKPRNSELTDQQDTFNMRLSSVRIHIEHTIGILKMRFQSLRELPIQLQDKDSAKHAVDWIKACMILHNMITAYRLDDIYNEEELTTILQEQQQQNSIRYDRRFNRATDLEEDLTPGKARRKEIFNQVMNSE